MKILISILVLVCSPLIAEEFEGLFGLKIGEELDLKIIDPKSLGENKKIGFDINFYIENMHNTLKKTEDKIEQLEFWQKNLRYWEFNYEVLPQTPNKMFEHYEVDITSLSKKIIKVIGYGTMDETQCKESRKLIFDFMIDKYFDFYEIKSKYDSDNNINLFKKRPNLEDTNTDGSDDIVISDLKPTSNPNNSINIKIDCVKRGILMSARDNELFRTIMDEQAIMMEKISFELEKLAQKDLDTSGF